ncbi:ABC transporter ATP-binding protein [Halapricum salinum]|uniref:ABC transporter ATP-binding protein n=1 Tax=Halapricum salinum TaxID=1457250 RepID=A0A4D6HBM9_9EURY|nr:ABC transporter ATP-binding protein [Halapricum salinum]QCC51035.1 ABC transporter ATP-binding protein [Halapricum salinum]
MTAPSPAISTRDLTKRYGGTTAVDGLTFEVPSGVVYGFLGPNGAGKTTTMRMLTGLVEPTDGDGFVAGTHCTERRHLVDHIGLLPEEPPLYGELTAREQLQFAADLRDLSWESVEERALGLADSLGLVPDLDRRVDGFSKGMKQKTAFIQTVQHDPDVVFLDEPTSGLDPRAARTLRELIVDLAAADTTVFLSTHILPVVEEIADQVGVLYDGRLVSEGSPADLTAGVGGDGEADLEDAFLELTDEPAAAWG